MLYEQNWNRHSLEIFVYRPHTEIHWLDVKVPIMYSMVIVFPVSYINCIGEWPAEVIILCKSPSPPNTDYRPHFSNSIFCMNCMGGQYWPNCWCAQVVHFAWQEITSYFFHFNSFAWLCTAVVCDTLKQKYMHHTCPNNIYVQSMKPGKPIFPVNAQQLDRRFICINF